MATKALAKKTKLEAAEEHLTVIRGACVGLSTLVDGLKRADSMGRCLVDLQKVASAISDMSSGLQEKLKELVLVTGEQTSEKGSKEYSVNGVTLCVRPTRTGLDSKKLEKYLRTQGLKLTDYMDEQVSISYKANTAKIESSSLSKKLTNDVLEQCKYDTNYSLQPVRIEEEPNE